MDESKISVTDFTLFVLVLVMSGLIGLYYGIIKRKIHSIEEYIFGSGNLPLIPVCLSNISSSVSSITMIVVPRETYYYGAQIIFVLLAEFAFFFIKYLFIVPVFYNLKFTSIFEYLEKRFNKFTRRLTSTIYCLTQIFYLLVIVYSSGKAVTQVFQIPFYIFSPIVCMVCIVSTAVGGLRGVVWVDTLQACIIMMSFMIFIIYGIYDMGGLTNVYNICLDGGRFNVDLFDVSPFAIYAPIYNFLSAIFVCMVTSGYNQGAMQRYLSLPSYEKAKVAVLLTSIGEALIIFLAICFGLLIYSTYHDCDPGLSQELKDTNHIVVYYILDKGKHLPGFTGLFLAGILSAALSSMSTMLNSVSAIIYEDLLKPVLPKTLTAIHINLLLKSLIVIIGLIISVATLILTSEGNMYQLFRIMLSLVSGLIIYVFSYGMFCRKANSKGAIIGGIAGVIITVWLSIGIQSAMNAGKIKYNTKIVNIEGCSQNLTGRLNLNLTTLGYLEYVPATFSQDLPYPYRISFNIITIIGFLVSVIVGFIFTIFTSTEDKDKEDLLVPQLRNNRVVATEYELQQLNTSS